MKLINYKRGYNNTFDCSIHGTIKMSLSEYYMVVNLLYNLTKDNFYRELLIDDFSRRIFIKNKKQEVTAFLINVRVPATEKIVEKFGLKNYKRGNYQLMVSQD